MGTVYLEPFIHQVGGHVSMLCFDDLTVCKPYVVREHEFYENLPADLRVFVPEYRGMIEVSLEKDSDGYLILTAYPPEMSVAGKTVGRRFDLSKFKKRRRFTRVRLKPSGSVELVNCGENNSSAVFEDVERHQIDNQNPWAIRCHLSHLAKLGSKGQSLKHQFILLENLTQKFHFPCILDLKMGFRQHGDDASEAKKKSQTSKCQGSTSSQLAVRMCGMQVYHKSAGVYKCLNKYYGRSLTVEGFEHVLRQFLFNGDTFRIDLIDPFVQKLTQLRQVLESTDRVRFYSSSLLLMYDGDPKCDCTTGGNSVKPRGDQLYQPLELSGNRKSSDFLSPPPISLSTTPDSCDSAIKASENFFTTAEAAACRKFSPAAPTSPGAQKRAAAEADLVDVRMIDFAHTSQNVARVDKAVHKGPDRGYVAGLENLIRLLSEMKAKWILDKQEMFEMEADFYNTMIATSD